MNSVSIMPVRSQELCPYNMEVELVYTQIFLDKGCQKSGKTMKSSAKNSPQFSCYSSRSHECPPSAGLPLLRGAPPKLHHLGLPSLHPPSGQPHLLTALLSFLLSQCPLASICPSLSGTFIAPWSSLSPLSYLPRLSKFLAWVFIVLRSLIGFELSASVFIG